MTRSRPSEGIWMKTPPTIAVHRPGRPLPRLHGHTLPPTTCTSFLLPWRTLPWMGVGRSGPPRGRICRTGGITGGGDSPPPGPLSCPARGDARSGPGGRSELRPGPGSPLRGTPLLSPPDGKISGMYSSLCVWGGGPSQVPISHPMLNLVVGIHQPRH